jgi:hypothetical protein
MNELESAQSFYSDFHKDLYGCRPCLPQTLEEVNEAIEWLRKDLPRVQEQETAASLAAIKSFESAVTATIEAGAKDRETAIRWLRQFGEPDDTQYQNDDGYFEYCNHLPYGYLSGKYNLSTWS